MPINQDAEHADERGDSLPAWLRAIDMPLSYLELVFRFLAGAALVLLVLNTGVNAALRNLFETQIPGSQNITILYFLPAIVFLGLTIVQSKDSHIAATLVTERLSPRGRRVCKIVANILIAFASYLMFTGAWSELIRAWGGSLGGSPDLPVGPSWLFVPVGFAVVMLRALQQTVVHAFYPFATASSLKTSDRSGESIA